MLDLSPVRNKIEMDAGAVDFSCAWYNLEVQPCTFDFVTWLAIVKSLGYWSVGFYGTYFKRKNNFPDDVAKARLERLVKPMCVLAQLPVKDGQPPAKPPLITHFTKGIFGLYKEFGGFWKYPYEQKHEHITITMRDSFRNRHRNSDRREWDKFAAWAENHGETVVILEDSEDKPIAPICRWDIYQCKMNLFVVGGTMNLCLLSDAPYIVMKWPGNWHDIYLQENYHCITRDMQLPWAHGRQRMVWETDLCDNIIRHYGEVMDGIRIDRAA